jgi:pimeloyl-ACP methyl ester carboxylesterase
MRIDVRGSAMSYDDTGGAGTPLVLVHGFPLDRRIWAAQARGLADLARVIVPDLPGFGESPAASGATSMDTYAGSVAGLLGALGVERAVIGGVSMGGYVAMAFHRRFAHRVQGLVFVATRAGPDSSEGRTARDAAAALARTEGVGAVAAQMIGRMLTPETARADPALRSSLLELMSAQAVEGVVAALAAMRDRPDSAPSNERIAVPTLVVCGAKDTLIPPKESEAIRDGVRGSRLTTIADAAHLPNYEQPEAFNRAVREFLKR